MFFLYLFFFSGILMFFIFLVHFFLKKKVSSFFFSCISFKYFLLLALASEFNCFLRSRCSTEMWCPDDIGRDGWGESMIQLPRVGWRLLACQNGASPDCIMVVVVVSDACLDVRCVWSTTVTETNWCQVTWESDSRPEPSARGLKKSTRATS